MKEAFIVNRTKHEPESALGWAQDGPRPKPGPGPSQKTSIFNKKMIDFYTAEIPTASRKQAAGKSPRKTTFPQRKTYTTRTLRSSLSGKNLYLDETGMNNQNKCIHLNETDINLYEIKVLSPNISHISYIYMIRGW